MCGVLGPQWSPTATPLPPSQAFKLPVTVENPQKWTKFSEHDSSAVDSRHVGAAWHTEPVTVTE